LIEYETGGNTIRIVVDCKLYNRKLNVNDVESFIGMIEDIGADKGIRQINFLESTVVFGTMGKR
jgi:hypothetical protein